MSEFGLSQEDGFLLARESLEKAMLNPTSLAHHLASDMNLHRYQWQAALVEAERAIALEPNNAIINLQMGYVLIMSGNPDNKDEYLYITDLKIFPFTPLD